MCDRVNRSSGPPVCDSVCEKEYIRGISITKNLEGSPTFAGKPRALGHFLSQKIVSQQPFPHQLQDNVPVLHVLCRHICLEGEKRG